MGRITEAIRRRNSGRKPELNQGITQNQFDGMIEKGIITAPQPAVAQDRIEETGRTLYRASVIVGEDGNPMCLIRVYRNARDPDSAIIKKLRIMEE